MSVNSAAIATYPLPQASPAAIERKITAMSLALPGTDRKPHKAERAGHRYAGADVPVHEQDDCLHNDRQQDQREHKALRIPRTARVGECDRRAEQQRHGGADQIVFVPRCRYSSGFAKKIHFSLSFQPVFLRPRLSGRSGGAAAGRAVFRKRRSGKRRARTARPTARAACRRSS